MFENLISDVLKEGANLPKKEDKEVSLLDNAQVFPSLYKSQLVNIDGLEESELYSIISGSLEFIVDNLDTGKNDYMEAAYFQNPRFLRVATNVILRRRNIDNKTLFGLNNISYQYTKSGRNDPMVLELMDELISATNRNIINEICNLTQVITQKQALNITSSFFSGKDNGGMKSLFRLNCELLALPEETMTEQNIIFIYESLVEYMRLSNLFKSTMLNYNLPISNKRQVDIMSTINLAVLNILNSQNFEVIRSVLIEYTNTFNYSSDRAVRFSLRAINATDFPRVVQMVNILATEGILVP